MIFKSEEESDPFISTRIDLNQGIPEQIFINRKDDTGDLHNFDAE